MAQTLYVNPATGSDSAAGSQSAPFKTITFALSQAQPGAVIQLAEGNYNAANGEVFPLEVPPGIEIVGNEANKGSSILIEGTGAINSPTFGSQNVALRLASDTALKGVSITNPTKPGNRGSGVWVESTNPTITNSTFNQCDREGIFVTGTGNPVIQSNVFTQNGGQGLTIVNNAKGEIRSNSFQKGGYGISVDDSASPLIVDNKISENRIGIVVSGNSRPVLRNNLSERNTDSGLTITGKALPDLGSSQDPGSNILRLNGQYDLQNTTSVKLVATGNQIDPAHIDGNIDLVNNQVPTPTPTPTPAPTPAPTPTPTPTPSSSLTDISGHWAAEFIQVLFDQGIISGFPDRTFKPNVTMTRAQYAALVVKAFNPHAKRDATTFKDVPESYWAFAQIQQAYRGGFISGIPDKTFRPNQNVQRVQVIASLVTGLGLTGGTQTVLNAYKDRAAIPNYAKDQMATATQQRLVVNYPTLQQLNPTRDATRAEVAALVYQALVNTKREAAINSPYIVTV